VKIETKDGLALSDNIIESRRRLAYMLITFDALCELFKDREIHVKVESSLPADAKLIHIAWDTDRAMVRLYFESKDFPVVEPYEIVTHHIKPLFHYIDID